ncbi:MAG: hypothetical protein RLY93_06020 [Sumerlaeia bacterium]
MPLEPKSLFLDPLAFGVGEFRAQNDGLVHVRLAPGGAIEVQRWPRQDVLNDAPSVYRMEPAGEGSSLVPFQPFYLDHTGSMYFGYDYNIQRGLSDQTAVGIQKVGGDGLELLRDWELLPWQLGRFQSINQMLVTTLPGVVAVGQENRQNFLWYASSLGSIGRLADLGNSSRDYLYFSMIQTREEQIAFVESVDLEEYTIQVWNLRTLSQEWQRPAPGTLNGPQVGRGIDLAAVGDRLVVGFEDGVEVLTLGGTPVWEADLALGDIATSLFKPHMATDGQTLLVHHGSSQFFQDEPAPGALAPDAPLVAYDLETGTELWRRTFDAVSVGPWLGQNPGAAPPYLRGAVTVNPIIVGDKIALAGLRAPEADLDGEPLRTLTILDLATGATEAQITSEDGIVLKEITGLMASQATIFLTGLIQQGEFAGAADRRAAAQGFGAVAAELVTSLAARSAIEGCGVTVGTPVRFEVEVASTGKGPAQAPRLEVVTSLSADIVIGSDPECRFIASAVGTCVLGGLEAAAEDGEPNSRTVEVTVIPQVPGSLTVKMLTADDERGGANSVAATFDLEVFPAAANLELTIDAIEVTQGVQDLNNSVPLVARKPALVRVYLGTNGARVTGVVATLEGRRGGLSLGFAEQLNGCLTLGTGGSDRADLTTTANFLLPRTWLLEDFELVARVDPEDLVIEANEGNNSRTAAVNLHPMPPVCTVSYPLVVLDSNGEPVTTGLIDPIASGQTRPVQSVRALSLLPIHRFDNVNIFEALKPRFGEAWDLDLDPLNADTGEGGKILDRLERIRALSRDPNDCDAGSIYAGYFSQNARSDMGGLARTPGHVQINVSNNDYNSNFPFDTPFGGLVRAHETAHNYGRVHVDCGIGGVGAGSILDMNYPHPPCQVAATGTGTEWGLDFADPTLISIIQPKDAADMLSYNSNRWISGYQWRRLMNEIDAGNRGKSSLGTTIEEAGGTVWPPEVIPPLRDTATGEAQVAEEAVKILGVSQVALAFGGAELAEDGSLDLDSVVLRSGELLAGEVPAPDPMRRLYAEHRRAALGVAAKGLATDLRVEVLAANGQVLASEPVVMAFDLSEAAPAASFTLLVPAGPGASAVRIVDADNAELARLEASANAPVIGLVQVSANDADRTITASWSGADADGDAISYTLLFSDDGGATWQVITETEATEASFDATSLPGTAAARVRVLVSDGFLTAYADSVAFTVAPREPQARILSPGEGAAFPFGALIRMQAEAFDPEEGSLPDEALVWEVDGAAAGSGEVLDFRGLAAGTRTVTLRATDSDGKVSEAATSFVVGQPLPTRGAAIAALLGQASAQAPLADRDGDGRVDAADLLARPK